MKGRRGRRGRRRRRRRRGRRRRRRRRGRGEGEEEGEGEGEEEEEEEEEEEGRRVRPRQFTSTSFLYLFVLTVRWEGLYDITGSTDAFSSEGDKPHFPIGECYGEVNLHMENGKLLTTLPHNILMRKWFVQLHVYGATATYTCTRIPYNAPL